MKKRKVGCGFVICALGLSGVSGCSDTRPKPLDTSLFVPVNHENIDTSVEPGLSAPAVAAVPATVDELPKTAEMLPSSPAKPFDAIQPLHALQASPTTAPVEISAVVDPPTPVAASATLPPVTLDPSNVSASAGQGVYMTLGGVLAQVNNTAIYSNQVLAPLRKEFAAKAREMDADAFRHFAEQEIGKQLQELIEDELYFAASYNALSEEDRKFAEQISWQVRQERVTAAGGSVERAKRLALADGEDFDESMKQEYRRIVHQLFQRRRIEPLIQVTADNMRDFYTTNISKLYSEKDKAQFRVIEIDPAIVGSKEAAMDKILTIRNKAIHGADFAQLASTENQNDFLKGRGGNPCDEGAWMDRDTYRLDTVEAALWKLEPGQITPVIEAEGALYIAKLDAKRLGKVRPFEDQAVQADIYNRLHQQQVADLWRKSKEDSMDDRIVNTDDKRIQIAVDMAMQTYAIAH